MEALEGYLMEDAPDYYLSSSPAAALKYSESSSLDEWWDFQIPENDNIHDLLFDFTPNLEEQFQGYSNNIAASSYPGEGVPCHHEQQEQELRQYCGDDEQYSCREQEEQLEEEDDFFYNGNDDEEEEVESDDLRKLSSCSSSKNLISERNRRKRLNQQLFTLRSLVPNISKMDKRSILVDALAYLQGILQETEALMKTSNFDSDITITREASPEPVIHDHQEEPAPVLVSHPDLQPQEYCIRQPIPTLTQVDAEMLDSDRFILKITCNRAIGAPGQVQKVIESLGLEITLVSIGELDQDYRLTMAFLRAKKKGVVTVEKLKHRVKVMAKRMSFLI